MTDAELSKLEYKAKAATPGPWRTAKAEFLENADIVRTAWKTTNKKVCDHILFDNCCFGKDRRGHIRLLESSGQQWRENAAFIAAANPAVVLELITELRQTRKEREWLAEQIGGNLPCPPYSIVIDEADCDNECCEDCWLKAAEEAICQK